MLTSAQAHTKGYHLAVQQGSAALYSTFTKAHVLLKGLRLLTTQRIHACRKARHSALQQVTHAIDFSVDILRARLTFAESGVEVFIPQAKALDSFAGHHEYVVDSLPLTHVAPADQGATRCNTARIMFLKARSVGMSQTKSPTVLRRLLVNLVKVALLMLANSCCGIFSLSCG